MPTKRYTVRLEAEADGVRLDAIVGRWLAPLVGRPLSKSSIRKAVMAGAILLDGRVIRRPGALLRSGQRLEARIDTARLQPSPGAHEREGSDQAPPLLDWKTAVLFQDRWLLAVAKPAGLQVHASADSSRPDLFTVVRDHLARAGGPDRSSPNPYLAIHHRLDIGTSGVVLFATDPAANAGLARAFAEHHVEKVYEAITGRPPGAPAAGWTSRGPLMLDGSGRAARVRVAAGGQDAETRFVIARRLPCALLIEARPLTGRKHQVRAHLAEAGLPILGDTRYGGAETAAGVRVPRVMLHAAALRLAHPVTAAPLDIRSPRPDDFQRLLDKLACVRGSLDRPRASR